MSMVMGEGARDAPLAMTPDEFRRAGHALVDRLAELLASVPERAVTPAESPTVVRELLGGESAPLPETGADAQTLLDSAAELLFDHSLFNGHPRFFGYITSSPAPIGMLADLLAAAVNANVGAWTLSPLATEIEAQTVRWIAQLIGYGAPCGGLLVSGGNMANLVAAFAARAAADKRVRDEGVSAPGAPPLRIYGSAETHTWIQKAADLTGLGTEAIRWIPTDHALRMDPDRLDEAIRHDIDAGARPMMVIGTAGSVSTGAVDPLAQIAAICREHHTWFHVDGAYGVLAAAVPGAAPGIEALREADSVAVDPHKWLYAPLEAGCTLVRDPERLRAAFSYHPPYYHFGVETTNYVDYGPQNSRGFRALKVWLALRQVGRQGYVRMIGDDIRLAARLHDAVAAHAELEPATLALSISTFRYVPADLHPRIGEPEVEEYLNALNEALLERIQNSGEAFVSNAVVRGRYLLRACIVNFHTDLADVDALPGIVARLGRDADAALRDERARP